MVAKVKDMSVADLEHFVESKMLEFLGDPDAGLQLRDEFKKKLKQRLKRISKRISHEEVLKQFA